MENRSHRDLSCGQSFFLSSFMCATERCRVPWRLGDSPGPLTGERVETNAYTSSEGTKVYRNHHHNAIRAKQNRRNQTHRESARFTSSAQTQTNGGPVERNTCTHTGFSETGFAPIVARGISHTTETQLHVEYRATSNWVCLSSDAAAAAAARSGNLSRLFCSDWSDLYLYFFFFSFARSLFTTSGQRRRLLFHFSRMLSPPRWPDLTPPACPRLPFHNFHLFRSLHNVARLPERLVTWASFYREQSSYYPERGWEWSSPHYEGVGNGNTQSWKIGWWLLKGGGKEIKGTAALLQAWS